MSERQQINRLANRALENLYGGWLALTEAQLMTIIDLTGGSDPEMIDARDALRVRLGDVSWSAVYVALDAGQGAERGEAT